MWTHRRMILNPRYGAVGLLAMPFFVFGEMLAPVVEVLGYVLTVLGLVTGVMNVSFALLFLLVAWGYGMLLSIWAVVLEEVSFHRYGRVGDVARLVAYAVLVTIGNRQRTVSWRQRALWSVRRRLESRC